MEQDQITKRVEWLDEERRKDKNTLVMVEDRITGLEGQLPGYSRQIKDLESEIARVAGLLNRMDQFDETVLQVRIEAKKALEELEKELRQRSDEMEKVRRLEMRSIENTVADVRKELTPIIEIKRSLQTRSEIENRLQREIDEVRLRVDTIRRSEEEYTRTYRLLEDGRRQDSKRLTDLQGEVSAIRKNVDEQRGRNELTATTLRKIEARLNEFSMVEAERREAQVKFLEEQTLKQVERDRVWKEWQARFETIEQQTADIEVNLQTLDATHREVRRSQQNLDELSVKVERRINELAEIQRLSEERFRQEWVTFRADDQKRWTNYTLTLEEQRGEVARQYERLAERATQVEDSLQEIQDALQLINEHTEKRLQSLLALVHDWVTVFERAGIRQR
jgi:DNA repair exonuclease SbcCD ATPase subunit